MAKMKSSPRDAAESLAIQALTWLSGDGERLGRFLTLAGLGPQSLRAAAREPGFLAAVLEHVSGDQALLKEFAAETGFEPVDVDRARRVLAGGDWERETP